MTRLRRRQRRAQRRLLRQAQSTLIRLGVEPRISQALRQAKDAMTRHWYARMKWKALRKWLAKNLRFSLCARLWWRWSPTNRRNIEIMYGRRAIPLAFMYGAGGRSFREIQWNVVQAHGLTARWTPDRLREQGREFRRQYRNSRSRG